MCRSCHFLFESDKFPEISNIIDEETSQLQTLQDEAKNWIRLSKIITKSDEKEKLVEKIAQERKEPVPPDDDAVLTIGIDDNVTETSGELIPVIEISVQYTAYNIRHYRQVHN